MTKKRPELAGEFSNPIVRPDPLLMALLRHNQSDRRQRLIRLAEVAWPLTEQYTRIQLIARAYGIEENDPRYWFNLSICLCNEFIEETKIYTKKPRGPGAPKKNSDELWSAIQTLRDQGFVVADACKRLSEGDGLWKGKPWKAIEARFYEVEKRMAELRKEPPTPFEKHVQAILNGDLDDFDDVGLIEDLERKDHGNSHH